MCCCGKPTINGEPGAYSWDGKTFLTRQPAPPALDDGDTLLFDEPGRCGGSDAHSHHYRLVKATGRGYAMLVEHGGGRERIELGCVASQVIDRETLDKLTSNQRFWLLHLLHSVHRNSASAANEGMNRKWMRAAAEKRIRTRKMPGRATVKVWIESADTVAAVIAESA